MKTYIFLHVTSLYSTYQPNHYAPTRVINIISCDLASSHPQSRGKRSQPIAWVNYAISATSEATSVSSDAFLSCRWHVALRWRLCTASVAVMATRPADPSSRCRLFTYLFLVDSMIPGRHVERQHALSCRGRRCRWVRLIEGKAQQR